MPEITIKQRKFIEKNRFSLSINEMAKSLGLAAEAIEHYLYPNQNFKPKKPAVGKMVWSRGVVGDNLEEKFKFDEKLALLILIAVTVLVYVNGLFGGFVSDDFGAIVNNPRVGDVLGNLVHPKTVELLNAITYNTVRLSSFWYHLNNLIFHVGSVVLVYLLVRLLTKKKWWAIVSTAIFALHPIATESVIWISGLPYVAYTFFGLLALVVMIAVREKRLSKSWLAAAVAALVLSALSSEKSVAFILIFLVYLSLFWSRKAAAIILGTIVSGGVIFFQPLWAIFFQRVLDANPSFAGGITFYNPLIQVPIALATYLKIFLLPVGLTYYHETFLYNPMELFFWYLLLLGFLGLGIFLYARKLYILLFALAIFLLGFAPTLLPIRIAWIVAERYAYLPSVGFALGLGYLLLQISRYNRWVFFAVTGIVLVLYSGLVFKRTFDWKNEETFWPATVTTSPDSTHAHYNMGSLYQKNGDLVKAKEEYQKAIELQPNNLEATNSLGTVNLQLGEATEAAKLFERAKSMRPQSADYFVSLAITAIKQKKYSEALQQLTGAQKLEPNSTLVYNTFGGLYFEMGDKKKAIEMLEKALSIDPGQAQVIQNLKYLKSLPQ